MGQAEYPAKKPCKFKTNSILQASSVEVGRWKYFNGLADVRSQPCNLQSGRGKWNVMSITDSHGNWSILAGGSHDVVGRAAGPDSGSQLSWSVKKSYMKNSGVWCSGMVLPRRVPSRGMQRQRRTSRKRQDLRDHRAGERLFPVEVAGKHELPHLIKDEEVQPPFQPL